jgi:hypothetical protein
MGLKTKPASGQTVRMTGVFLKSTGQQKGGDGPKRWKVLACACGLCVLGKHVSIDEPYDDAYRAKMWGDLPENERPKYRHVAIANLEIVGAPPKAEDYP